MDLFGGDTVGPAYADKGKWNGFTFTDRAVSVVKQHAEEEAGKPLFLYMALHNTHAPFEVPAQYADLYNYSFPLQKTWAGMVSMVDETVKNVTIELKAQKMWGNTLLIMAGDNGSPVCGWGAAGSNAPLRGGKASNWEGGVHTFAFAVGGFLPATQKGKSISGMIHICDFYKTFVTMAGGDPSDAGGPAPLDSIDQSAYILGTSSKSARTIMIHDHYISGGSKNPAVEATANGAASLPPLEAAEFDPSAFGAAATVTMETKYPVGAGCTEHFSNHFWLRTADLATVGIPAKGATGALTINGKAVNIQHLGPDSKGSGCSVSVCDGCPLSLFQIHPFTISGLNLHPGANATVSYSATPVPAPPPPPPPPPHMEATGAIRMGDFKLLVGPQRMATWFGMFSPNATFNNSATGTTACAERPCLFNLADDPNEHVDLADSNPMKAKELLAKFYTFNSEFHPGNPIGSDKPGYCTAAEAHKGFSEHTSDLHCSLIFQGWF